MDMVKITIKSQPYSKVVVSPHILISSMGDFLSTDIVTSTEIPDIQPWICLTLRCLARY